MREAVVPRLSARTLLGVALGCASLATAVVLCAVLPAESGRDPTGFGRWSGLSRLAAPARRAVPPPAAVGAMESVSARFEGRALRSDTLDIPLASSDLNPAAAELEYKVAMKAGAALVYSWTVEGLPGADEFYYDFHSETDGGPDPRVEEYRQATGSASGGSLVAPFDGIHGWYFQNQSSRPVRMHLQISGFYQLIPPGQPGNLGGAVPRVTAPTPFPSSPEAGMPPPP